MLRGKELGWHLDGRDNLMEALLAKEQAIIPHHETQVAYTEKPKPRKPLAYYTYDQMPSIRGHKY